MKQNRPGQMLRLVGLAGLVIAQACKMAHEPSLDLKEVAPQETGWPSLVLTEDEAQEIHLQLTALVLTSNAMVRQDALGQTQGTVTCLTPASPCLLRASLDDNWASSPKVLSPTISVKVKSFIVQSRSDLGSGARLMATVECAYHAHSASRSACKVSFPRQVSEVLFPEALSQSLRAVTAKSASRPESPARLSCQWSKHPKIATCLVRNLTSSSVKDGITLLDKDTSQKIGPYLQAAARDQRSVLAGDEPSVIEDQNELTATLDCNNPKLPDPAVSLCRAKF